MCSSSAHGHIHCEGKASDRGLALGPSGIFDPETRTTGFDPANPRTRHRICSQRYSGAGTRSMALLGPGCKRVISYNDPILSVINPPRLGIGGGRPGCPSLIRQPVARRNIGCIASFGVAGRSRGRMSIGDVPSSARERHHRPPPGSRGIPGTLQDTEIEAH